MVERDQSWCKRPWSFRMAFARSSAGRGRRLRQTQHGIWLRVAKQRHRAQSPTPKNAIPPRRPRGAFDGESLVQPPCSRGISRSRPCRSGASFLWVVHLVDGRLVPFEQRKHARRFWQWHSGCACTPGLKLVLQNTVPRSDAAKSRTSSRRSMPPCGSGDHGHLRFDATRQVVPRPPKVLWLRRQCLEATKRLRPSRGRRRCPPRQFQASATACPSFPAPTTARGGMLEGRGSCVMASRKAALKFHVTRTVGPNTEVSPAEQVVGRVQPAEQGAGVGVQHLQAMRQQDPKMLRSRLRR